MEINYTIFGVLFLLSISIILVIYYLTTKKNENFDVDTNWHITGTNDDEDLNMLFKNNTFIVRISNSNYIEKIDGPNKEELKNLVITNIREVGNSCPNKTNCDQVLKLTINSRKPINVFARDHAKM
jgi:hypothetical protein